MPAVNRSIFSIFSMISPKRRTGSLEGTHDLAAYALPYTRPERPFLDQIDPPSEQIRKPVLDPNHVEQRELAGVIKRREQVDIRVRLRFIPRHRAEQRDP